MIENFTIPELRNKSRKTVAVLALSGAAFTGTGCSNGSLEFPEDRPKVGITIPETGEIDTLGEFLEVYCEDTLDDSELKDAISLTQRASNKSTTGVQRGEKLLTYVGVCDLVQEQ